MLGCFVVVLVCVLGLFRFRQEKNPIKLWVPPDSDFVTTTEWLMSHYLETLRIQTFILTDDNVLEQQTLIRVIIQRDDLSQLILDLFLIVM